MMVKMMNSLKDLIAINSVAEPGKDGLPYGPGPAKAMQYVMDLCKELGFRTCVKEKYGYVEIGEGNEMIGILSHLDVVPAGEGWTYEPFAGELVQLPSGDRIYGRGSIDDKGPTIACIYAMKDLQDEGYPIHKRIRLILGQTEENGDWKDMEAYREVEEIPDYGITPDGDFPAIYCEKGSMVITVDMPLATSGVVSIDCGTAPNMVPAKASLTTADGTFEGTGKPYHGCAPWGGYHALDDLLKKMKADHPLPDEPFFNMYSTLFENKIYGEGVDCDFYDEESGRLTINIGKIRVEGDQIRLWLDIRYPITAEPSVITNRIREKVKAYGAHADCVHHMEPVYMDKNGPVMQQLIKAYRKHTNDDTEPIVIGGGTYARAMPNIIAFGPNFPGHENREHQGNEYILVEDFVNLRHIYKDALKNLLNTNVNQ